MIFKSPDRVDGLKKMQLRENLQDDQKAKEVVRYLNKILANLYASKIVRGKRKLLRKNGDRVDVSNFVIKPINLLHSLTK